MARSAAAYINRILDPIMAKRAGVSLALMNAWSEIVGTDVASMSLPLKVKWPNQLAHEDIFKPGTLMIAAEGMAALHIQHQTGEIIDKVNAFMGYQAIDHVRLTQKPVEVRKPKKQKRPITQSEKRKIKRLAESIEDIGLKNALERFGQNVLREKK